MLSPGEPECKPALPQLGMPVPSHPCHAGRAPPLHAPPIRSGPFHSRRTSPSRANTIPALLHAAKPAVPCTYFPRQSHLSHSWPAGPNQSCPIRSSPCRPCTASPILAATDLALPIRPYRPTPSLAVNAYPCRPSPVKPRHPSTPIHTIAIPCRPERTMPSANAPFRSRSGDATPARPDHSQPHPSMPISTTPARPGSAQPCQSEPSLAVRCHVPTGPSEPCRPSRSHTGLTYPTIGKPILPAPRLPRSSGPCSHDPGRAQLPTPAIP